MFSALGKTSWDASGATVIEGGLVAALTSGPATAAFVTVGTDLCSRMTSTANSLK